MTAIPATNRFAIRAPYGLAPPALPAPLNNNALFTIRNFSNCSFVLLQGMIAADPTIQFPSSRAMLDSLLWLTQNVFTNALRTYLDPFQIPVAYAAAETAVDQLWTVVNAAAALAVPAYVPVVPGTVLGTVPSVSPLELLYETLLYSANAATPFVAFSK
jgi:hypothetical protein